VNETSVSAVTDVDTSANSFAEDATEGTVVGITAQATDADATDTVTYSVSDDRFTVGDDGVITVAAGATFDYESEPTIKVAVTATSSDGSTSQETFELAVSDVAETYQLAEGQTTFTDTGVAETSITGNDSADTITAHDDGSTIYSGAGDDTIYGGAGDDTILFGEGADVVYGGAGDDFIDDERGSQPNTGDNYLDGGEGNDTMYGGGGNDTMIGGAGNDTLRGEGDDDTLDGGDGDDILVGGVGDDSIDGGSGNDAVYYSGNRSDYDITENSDGSYTVIDTRTDSPDGTDTVSNVEKFCFSDGDVLAGDLIAKDVSTVSDSDTAANTIIENGEEGSTVGIKAFADDANTSDSVSYSVNDARFSVDDDGTVRLAAGASFDYESEPEINITVTATSTDGSSSSESFSLSVSDVSENLQLADGGVTFTDTSVAETAITGGTGDDAITAHNDGGTTIDGGEGSDKLLGGAGNDMLIGGAGADLLQGGAGDDTFQVGSDGTWSSGYSAQNTVTDETVSITGRIRSSDVFEGGEGTDTLLGTDGSDAIFLHDTYSDKHADASEPRLVSIENVNLGAGDDILDMTSDTHAYTTDMTVDGGEGDDIIWTGAGNDTIIGGEGNDSLFGGAGNDTLDGGAGTDTAIYSGNWEDYDIVHNDDGSYTISDLRADAPDGVDTVSNVESYRFADVELQSDELIDRPVGDVSDTDSAENTIHELDGAGTHVGITAFAEDPNGEAITYTLSDDRFEFGADGVVTVADHAFFDSQVENSIDLTVTATSEDGSQSNQSFAVSVTGAYDGTFTGGDEAGSFTGTDKSYSVDGGGGDDTITTGDFNDRLDGGANGGNDTLDGGGGNDLMFGRGGDDVIYGRAGDDTIIGGAGNDTLYGGDGSDLFMHGLGDGNDTIDAGAGAGWTDVIDLGGGPDIASAGVYETDWTVTITSGSIESTDTDGGRIDLSQDADGYIDFADGSRVNFNDVEEIRW
jgi:Ca2+-binding RTX toxin-like protein